MTVASCSGARARPPGLSLWWVAALLALCAAGARSARAEGDDLVVIVNAANPIAAAELALDDVFLRKRTAWPSGERIIPLNAAADSDRRQRFDRVVLGMSPEEAARYWLDVRIRGGGAAPREVADPALTVKLIARLVGTIGYVPDDTALDGVRVVARIRDAKVVRP